MDLDLGKLLVGTSPLSLIPFILSEIRGRRILDIGCGAGIYGYLIRNKWQDCYPGRIQFEDFQNRCILNDEPELLVGCDVTTENIRRVNKHQIYDYSCLANAANLPFKEGLFDTIICVEVLEHLEKKDAIKAIEQFKRIATQRLIITVPKNALSSTTNSDERPFLKIASTNIDIIEYVEAERHKSSFTQRELSYLGFQIGDTVEGSGLRTLLKKLRRVYRNRWGVFSAQHLAVMDLHGGCSNVEINFPVHQKETESIPDFR